MRPERFQPTLESEARLLLLISAFSQATKVLEGRTKLAKLDFLLRYPKYLQQALAIRRPQLQIDVGGSQPADIESRMVRYRYGPWDPAYFALLGRLIGKGLIRPVPYNRGIGYKVTDRGQGVADSLSREPSWEPISERVAVLRRHFDLAGTTLKNFIYEHFPEVTRASWGESL